jgi:transposase
LVGTKYAWLRNPEKMTEDSTSFFERMKRLALRTARAWAIKEHAMCLWHYASRGWARRAWRAWISWALRSRLAPVKRVARMVRAHLEGIINAIVLRATNAGAESVNAKVQRIKRMACGFRILAHLARSGVSGFAREGQSSSTGWAAHRRRIWR